MTHFCLDRHARYRCKDVKLNMFKYRCSDDMPSHSGFMILRIHVESQLHVEKSLLTLLLHRLLSHAALSQSISISSRIEIRPVRARPRMKMIARRCFSTARSLRAQAVTTVPKETGSVAASPAPTVVTQSPTLPRVKVKRSIGGLRGGITGFLLGVAVSGSLGYSYLLTEYQNASALLLNSVEELQSSTSRITGYVRRIEEVEANLGKIQKSSATQQDHSSLRKEMHKVYNGLNVEQLDLKSKITDLENNLAKSLRSK